MSELDTMRENDPIRERRDAASVGRGSEVATGSSQLPVNELLYEQPESGSSWQLDWQMTRWERLGLIALLRDLSPRLSVEIGTYRGGSLQALARFSKSVISIDVDPRVERNLGSMFTNVSFLTGDSGQLLPRLVKEWNTSGPKPDLVLIDGDHTRDGVRRDIENIIELRPNDRTFVLLHDSFNPECRSGMRVAEWHRSPYVQLVELDYVPGVFHEKAGDTAEPRSMWGGLACAILEPQVRRGDLEIRESQRLVFETMRGVSSHRQLFATLATSKRIFKALMRG